MENFIHFLTQLLAFRIVFGYTNVDDGVQLFGALLSVRLHVRLHAVDEPERLLRLDAQRAAVQV